MTEKEYYTDDKDFYITDKDLKERKYPIEDLIKNVLNLEIKTLLRHQILTADFCKKYILNEEYQTVSESYTITYDYVLKRQPHLKYEDLIDE